MCRHGQLHQTQIAQHVGDATIEEDESRALLCKMVGTHLPRQHQFSKEGWVAPWQGTATDRDLVLYYTAAGLNRSGVAALVKGLDQRAFAGARATGQNEEAFRLMHHHSPVTTTSG